MNISDTTRHFGKISSGCSPAAKEMPFPAPTLLAITKHDFDPRKFLATNGEGRKIAAFRKKQAIFSQGDAADAVFYVQKARFDCP